MWAIKSVVSLTIAKAARCGGGVSVCHIVAPTIEVLDSRSRRKQTRSTVHVVALFGVRVVTFPPSFRIYLGIYVAILCSWAVAEPDSSWYPAMIANMLVYISHKMTETSFFGPWTSNQLLFENHAMCCDGPLSSLATWVHYCYPIELHFEIC